MSHYQTASVVIVIMGATLFLVEAPLLRVASRGYHAPLLHHEANLVVWISWILGLIIAMLGYVTYLQS